MVAPCKEHVFPNDRSMSVNLFICMPHVSQPVYFGMTHSFNIEQGIHEPLRYGALFFLAELGFDHVSSRW